jgi:glucose/arabinose dehydrogenase
VARAELGADGLQDARVIFRQTPRVDGPNHWGSRLVFARDGTLFVTLGERFKFGVAQDLSNTLGKIVRINPDGSVPKDNPFVGKEGARPEIWSYGHRNVQGAAIHPETGVLWSDEMGPLGGDELNIAEAGKNYGWPLVSWGSHYDGRPIPKPPTRPDLAAPIYYWNPVISPSGMTFYTADAIPAWKGSLLIAGLSAQALVRLTLAGEKVTGEERIPMGARIRDVRQAPDGSIHLLTDEDNGKILHLLPEQRGT